MAPKTPETTDWLSSSDRQFWFEQFSTKTNGDLLVGLKFNQFQEFLEATLYTYFKRLPAKSSDIQQQNVEPAKFSYQQEMQLFKTFDTRNDHVIDREEFACMCLNWLDKIYRRSSALVIVDVQNDFIDGSLALINGPAKEDGAQVVPVINKLLDDCSFTAIVYTQDWHPANHIGFYDNLHLRKYSKRTLDSSNDSIGRKSSNNNGEGNKFKLNRLISEANLFDTVYFDEGRVEQKLWPRHCVQDSWGAELHQDLKVMPNAVRIQKGTLPHLDAYSAFWDNMRLNETGLRQELVSRNINDVFFCGLALDYCVAASAIDSAKAGFITFVIEDACRGIDKVEMSRRRKEMLDHGIIIVNSDDINEYLLHHRADKLRKNSIFNRAFMINFCFKRAFQ